MSVERSGIVSPCTGKRPHHHIKIERGWKRMVKARNMPIDVSIKIGAPRAGNNDALYLEARLLSVF